jgi:hypothetical protein
MVDVNAKTGLTELVRHQVRQQSGSGRGEQDNSVGRASAQAR